MKTPSAFNRLFMVALVIILPVLGYAQEGEREPKTPEERAQKWTNWMKKELQLTAEQESSVHTINLAYAQKNETLREDERERREKLQDLRVNDEAKDKELKAVLTPEQFEKYKVKKKDMQKRVVKAARKTE